MKRTKTVEVQAPQQVRVLVIDDDPVSLLATGHILSGRGEMDVTTATGPLEALDLLDSSTFDLVLTDVQMPEMDGLQLLTRLRDASPGLPVVVVTGDPRISAAQQVIRSEADGYLFKPLDPAKLVRMVSRLARPEPAPEPTRRRLFSRRG